MKRKCTRVGNQCRAQARCVKVSERERERERGKEGREREEVLSNYKCIYSWLSQLAGTGTAGLAQTRASPRHRHGLGGGEGHIARSAPRYRPGPRSNYTWKSHTSLCEQATIMLVRSSSLPSKALVRGWIYQMKTLKVLKVAKSCMIDSVCGSSVFWISHNDHQVAK